MILTYRDFTHVERFDIHFDAMWRAMELEDVGHKTAIDMDDETGEYVLYWD